ncbi:MAG: hypothetical protein RR073_04975 [Clostridia bacterium]
MFEKMKLKSQIKELKKVIEETEAKRSRSQSALVAAILDSREPDEQDVEFFNKYTATIDETREELKKAEQALLKA